MSVAQISPYDVQSLIKAAIEGILAMPIEDRAGWVIYLLEHLENGITDREHRSKAVELLRDVLSAVSVRLDEGMW